MWLTKSTVRPLRLTSHLAEALLLERGIPDGEHLVDDQDLGLEMAGTAKARRTCIPLE